jgi:uncharacterized protein (DUF1330 family)
VTAYLIARVQIRDMETYSQYAARTPAIIAKHGGRFLVRGGLTETLEGDTTEGRLVVVEFPSLDAARAFYHSPEYQEARDIRVPVSDAHFAIVAGVE